ncbi:hypothetical protein [Halobacillus mangrovi]|uniref:Uncharacterized protein n=1 Tax=Halobacillus mangrovi TaxID=402384 RepID=A0A1W5ZYG4_9BACI|nr:hypothetical protein [Halobacillus mangrovi]ARI78303.1 hypothetical protein HM131_16310 [Halobacillus mangrovi]
MDKSEVKKLRWKQWGGLNAFLIVLLAGFEGYLRLNLPPKWLLLGVVVAVVVIVGMQYYQWRTGKIIGLKINRQVQRYEREKIGEKQWNKQLKIGMISLLVFAVLLLLMAFFIPLPSKYHPTIGNYIGSVIGVNIGFLLRIRKIDRSNKEDLKNFSRDMAVRGVGGALLVMAGGAVIIAGAMIFF